MAWPNTEAIGKFGDRGFVQESFLDKTHTARHRRCSSTPRGASRCRLGPAAKAWPEACSLRGGCRTKEHDIRRAVSAQRGKARQVDGARRSSTRETSTRWTSPFFAEGRQNDGRDCLKLFCLWAALLIVLDLLVTSQGSFNAHLTWATPQHLQLLRSEEKLPRIGYTCAPSEQTVLPILSCFREDVGMDFSHIGRWPPDSSTIFGLGILAGVALFWWTGVPEVGLIAAAAVKILLPQHRPGEEENPLDVVEEVAETLA